jgi:predicted nucleic-acid-binding protein
VVGFDTNVVVRLLMNDNLAQVKIAEEVFIKHAKDGGIFLSLLVLAEVTWVLAYSYGLAREEIHARLSDLVRTQGIFVEDLDIVEQALEHYRQGKADLADFLILGKAHAQGARPLVTFDKKLGREAGAKLL